MPSRLKHSSWTTVAAKPLDGVRGELSGVNAQVSWWFWWFRKIQKWKLWTYCNLNSSLNNSEHFLWQVITIKIQPSVLNLEVYLASMSNFCRWYIEILKMLFCFDHFFLYFFVVYFEQVEVALQRLVDWEKFIVFVANRVQLIG